MFGGNLNTPGPQPIASSVTFDYWRLSDENDEDQVFAVKSLREWKGGPAEKVKEVRGRQGVISMKRSLVVHLLEILQGSCSFEANQSSKYLVY